MKISLGENGSTLLERGGGGGKSWIPWNSIVRVFQGNARLYRKNEIRSWNLFCLVARILLSVASFLSSRRGEGEEEDDRSQPWKLVPSGLASAGRFTRRHGRWIGVEMRGKRRLLFINEPSPSNEGRASGWSWLNEHWATILNERNWLFLPVL